MSPKDASRPAIVVDGVTKRFRLQQNRPASLKEKVTKRRFEGRRDFYALRDVSFAVPSGSMFGLVGHNGSGKSTLLRIIAGIYKPTSGKVATTGRISSLLELGAGFHPDLSGRENIYLNASILGMTRKETDRLYASIVDFSGLQDFIETPVRHYSSGMYVRLGFSVAVHVDPDILMVDEVIAVGDTDFQRRCHEHFYTLRSRGTTIVIVTHGLTDVKNMCDEVAWLDHGELRAVGPAGEMVRRYTDEVNLAEAERHERTIEQGDVDENSSINVATIDKVDVLGLDGEPLAVLSPHDPVVLDVHYTLIRPVEGARMRFAIVSEQELVLAGTPNDQACVLPTQPGQGRARFVVPSLPFGPGDYLVSIDLTDPDFMVTFAQVDRIARLRVRPGPVDVAGLLRLDGSWDQALAEADQPK